MSAREEIERVAREYGPALRRLAASYERDAALREDLLQEILLALLGALPAWRRECSERTFVYRVAHNRAMSHLARRRQPPEDLARAAKVADPAPSPETVLTAAEHRDALFGALERLPIVHRQILTMALDGLSGKEIADVLGISENNAGVRLNRARTALREAMRAARRQP
jgi:RNA polymerase sigma factor (sigma-70 family)